MKEAFTPLSHSISSISHIEGDSKRESFTLVDKVIYCFLRSAIKNMPKCYVSNRTMAQTFGVSESTVSRSVSKLRKHGLLETSEKKVMPNGTYRIYYLKVNSIKKESHPPRRGGWLKKDNIAEAIEEPF